MSFFPVAPFIETKYKREVRKKCSSEQLCQGLSEYVVDFHQRGLQSAMSFDIGQAKQDHMIRNMAIDELYWNDTGRKCIFLESKEFVEAILNSKFDVDTIKNLKPLAGCFYLVMPKGVFNDHGDELQNAIISWDLVTKDSGQRNVNYIQTSHDKLGLEPPTMSSGTDELIEKYDLGDEAKDIISSITAGDNADENLEEQQVLNIYLHGTEDILTQSIYECNFADLLSGKRADSVNTQMSSMFKLILGLAIYVNAGGELRTGLPMQKALTTRARKALEPAALQGYTLEHLGFAKEMKTIGKGFVRGFHFRNLVADRFYRNEFKDLPKGSRWVFVKPTWIGSKIDPKTATGNKG